MTVREPKKRSNLRLKLGGAYFSAQRKLRWLSMRKHFARERSGEDLAYQAFSHHTPLMRKLKDVDMQLQRNKVTNLRLACARLDGLLLRPGETMSYWYLIGKPTAGKGYLPGMILRNGGYLAATGGGLCQLSNLIYAAHGRRAPPPRLRRLSRREPHAALRQRCDLLLPLS